MDIITTKIKELMESIIPGITTGISSREPLTVIEPLDEEFDLACKEYLAWMMENELNISVSETDVANWITFQDICQSVQKSLGQ